MIRWATCDDANEPARVRVGWPSAPRRWAGGSARARLSAVEPVVPALLFACGVGGWLALLWAKGPMVLAVTLFSPVSSTSIVAVVALVLWFRGAMGRHVRRTVARSLEARVCPSCGQGLAGVPVGERGLTRCPECGARWEMDPARGRIVVSTQGAGWRTGPESGGAEGDGTGRSE